MINWKGNQKLGGKRVTSYYRNQKGLFATGRRGGFLYDTSSAMGKIPVLPFHRILPYLNICNRLIGKLSNPLFLSIVFDSPDIFSVTEVVL